MGATNKLLLLMQHAEDNVYTCVVNHALFNGIINTVKDLQGLNRCTKETACGWEKAASTGEWFPGWEDKILALSCWKLVLFRRQADLFEKHFQIVQGRESQSDRSDLPRVALSEQLEKALDANLWHPDEMITASSI